MENKEPLVSIVITSFNRSEFIETAIQSALDQDYPNIEIIISDNHSTDNTDEIMKKYTHDARIKYFVNATNIGMIPNFKLATEQRAKGLYLTYLSSDDYFCNNKFISASVNLIYKYPDIVLVAAKNATLYEDMDKVIEDDTAHIFQQEFRKGTDLFKKFPKWFSPGSGGVLMDREKLTGTRIFESKAQSLDYEANLKLMLQGNVAFIEQPSYVFRRHSSQASGTMNFETSINNFDFIENVCRFAKKLNVDVDIETWRQQVYYEYLNGIARRMIKQKSEFKKTLDYVNTQKGIHIRLVKSPKYFILFKIYKNYDKVSGLLKYLYPGLYHSIEKDK